MSIKSLYKGVVQHTLLENDHKIGYNTHKTMPK